MRPNEGPILCYTWPIEDFIEMGSCASDAGEDSADLIATSTEPGYSHGPKRIPRTKCTSSMLK